MTMSKFLLTASAGGRVFSMTMYSPEMPIPSDFNLYWNQSTHFRVSVEHQGTRQFDHKEAKAARRITKKILHSAHGSRMLPADDDFVTYFLPVSYSESSIRDNGWTQTSTEHRHHLSELDGKDLGIVMLKNTKHIFKRFAAKERAQLTDAGATKIGPNVIVSQYPKRRDL